MQQLSGKIRGGIESVTSTHLFLSNQFSIVEKINMTESILPPKINRRKAIYRKHDLKRHYNITESDFDKLRQKQNYACAICQKPESDLNQTFHIDHCHNSNEIRGLLCVSCNIGLGMVFDSKEILKNLVNYLTKEHHEVTLIENPEPIKDGYKFCCSCQEIKVLDDFYNHPKGKFGKMSSCKKCEAIRAKTTRSTPEGKAKLKKYNDYYLKFGKKPKTSNPPKKRKPYTYEQRAKWKLKGKYGISVEEYQRLAEAQNYCCLGCGTRQSELKKTLFVDHCHVTKTVRGLLCQNCNFAVGCFQDNPGVCANAIKYLKN